MQNAFKGSEFVYNHPKFRVKDLMDVFKDESVKDIFCTIGGSDSIRLLPYIDYDVIKNNPKIFYGIFRYNSKSFYDGNGRVGRLLMNFILLIHNHPPITIFEEDRKDYYNALERYDEEFELNSLIDFLKLQLVKIGETVR